MTDYYHSKLEDVQGSSLPVKEKLIILDRDILSLKLTDHALDKRVQQMHRLVRTQMIMILLNLSICSIMIYLIVNDIYIN